MNNNFTAEMIETLATKVEIPSTKDMTTQEKIDGTSQMIKDLDYLAKDGCISAAWALEILREISCNNLSKEDGL